MAAATISVVQPLPQNAQNDKPAKIERQASSSRRQLLQRSENSARHTAPSTHKRLYRAARFIEGFVWALLGLLIFVWLFTGTPELELVLWIGFGIGCSMTGGFIMHHAVTQKV